MPKTQKTHKSEAHTSSNGQHLNRIRAAVLGANDGIVSIAGLVVGVAGATHSRAVLLTAGLAGLASGALSMAAGEYVSVSSQKDSETAMLAKERYELENYPDEEIKELAQIYRSKGLTANTARQVADELTEHDAYAAHFEAELGIDPNDLASPWQAAVASALSFTAGGILPLLTIVLLPSSLKVPLTFVIVLVALALTGTLAARAGGAHPLRPTVRVVIGGALAMIITYSIGHMFHISGV